ncbi:hypothetical protein J2Z21_009791 [Streptomyces griseochromogenes]|uniref:Uncharacterized protein n=1 Tax=Streptomyces griseochromogenes TaxID=68214 RepID=A0A1B1ASM5_9ACTN|nr:hypothetical protein AVL59_07970 [Streptomyces griseochromogenes]MBP2056772.1 hypothetical protein [Streptomyces griseochromogenes]
MTDLIRRLAAWVFLPLGRRDADLRPRPPALRLRIDHPQWHDTPLPPHRSPYALDVAPLDATAVRSVRPYLTACEQRQRRRELALAALGQDVPGSFWIHGLEVA